MNLHCKLKHETQDHHTKIESVSLLKKIMAANIALEEYQVLLQTFYGYIAPCETIILDSPYRFLLANRNKTSLLEKDLLALGMDTRSISKLQRCGHLPELHEYEQAIGYLYVWEGATLGGQLITKALEKTLQLRPDNGLTYFYGYGKETAARWDAFCHFLNEIEEERYTKIITSVHMVYATLYDWMLDHDVVYENHQKLLWDDEYENIEER